MASFVADPRFIFNARDGVPSLESAEGRGERGDGIVIGSRLGDGTIKIFLIWRRVPCRAENELISAPSAVLCVL